MSNTSQYLKIGCYGKLPCHEEWLEEMVSFPSSRALKQWILEGRRTVLEANEDPANKDVGESARRRFLFGLPGSVELVVGVIRPSSDMGGLRTAPFMIFANLPRRYYGRGYGLLPMALAPVWEALDDAWESLAAASSLASFKELIASTMVPMPASSGEVKAIYESHQSEALGRVFASRGDGARLDRLARNLPSALEKLRKGGETASLCIELPVSQDREAAAFDASYWLDLVNRQFFWKRHEPSVFLDGRGGNGDYRVLLFFGMIGPSDYPIAMKCGKEAVEVCRPAREPAPDGVPDAASSEDMTYAQFLARRIVAGA